jgi:hypothetical protein
MRQCNPFPGLPGIRTKQVLRMEYEQGSSATLKATTEDCFQHLTTTTAEAGWGPLWIMPRENSGAAFRIGTSSPASLFWNSIGLFGVRERIRRLPCYFFFHRNFYPLRHACSYPSEQWLLPGSFSSCWTTNANKTHCVNILCYELGSGLSSEVLPGIGYLLKCDIHISPDSMRFKNLDIVVQ